MKLYNPFLILMMLYFVQVTTAQDKEEVQWQNPAKSNLKFEGQGWENIGYGRLPDAAKSTVRDAVWSLSRSSAGLGIRFVTDADSISIQYQVGGNIAMNHMPATGVSGVDLYVKKDEEWLWCRGKFKFNDTIQYDFVVDLLSSEPKSYQIYFPLYNNIKNLKIGVPSRNFLKLLTARTEKPIVVYGTSIAQGACASRPGMAWTNILSRKLDYPVVNLGFSGNGRLEPEVIDLINEIDASVFVLDCLPNLPPTRGYDKKDVQNRISRCVTGLREKHPETSILLVHHAGYSDGLVNADRKAVYESLNAWTTETFEKLRKEGVNNLFMLTKDEIGLSNDAFVDGTHPTDSGMEQYALAYEKILTPLLKNAK